ncbi:MAG: alpha/beta hydrolase [Bacteroidetes bacterium]|nr:alpha/beta hydrolase [Bacteroidota bacterium]
MKKYIITISLVMLIIQSACLRLDSFLFNNSTIEEYLLDDYPLGGDIVVGDDYKIDDTMIHLFTLNSKLPEETESVEIWALYVGDINTIDTDTVILYCHGNRDHMDFYWPRVKLLAHIGGKNRYGVMMFDYRGFGLSGGIPSEAGMYADTEAALKWLRSKGLTNERLITYGFSLGSAPATLISSENYTLKPNKLILENPFASFEVMVHDGSAITLPGSYLANLKINNAEHIKNVSQPFLWMHGTDDMFLSIETHGEVIFKNYSGEKGFAYRIENAEHSTLPPVMGYNNYLSVIEKFILDTLE